MMTSSSGMDAARISPFFRRSYLSTIQPKKRHAGTPCPAQPRQPDQREGEREQKQLTISGNAALSAAAAASDAPWSASNAAELVLKASRAVVQQTDRPSTSCPQQQHAWVKNAQGLGVGAWKTAHPELCRAGQLPQDHEGTGRLRHSEA